MKTAAQTCNLGPTHSYLGHFGKAVNINKGHNTTETIPAIPGHKAITFQKGGLHRSTNTPEGQKIPAAKKAKALAGGYGSKAEKQARFAKNVLTGGK